MRIGRSARWRSDQSYSADRSSLLRPGMRRLMMPSLSSPERFRRRTALRLPSIDMTAADKICSTSLALPDQRAASCPGLQEKTRW